MRACKFRRADLRGNSPVSGSTAASSDEECKSSDGIPRHAAAQMQASKFAKQKTLIKPKAKNSSSVIEQAIAFQRQATMAPHRDHQTIFAVKIISKNKVLQSQQ